LRCVLVFGPTGAGDELAPHLVQGWLGGSDRFSQTHSITIVLAEALNVAWMMWPIVVAWRMQDSEPRRSVAGGVLATPVNPCRSRSGAVFLSRRCRQAVVREAG
jgi:hypothetical protein